MEDEWILANLRRIPGHFVDISTIMPPFRNGSRNLIIQILMLSFGPCPPLIQASGSLATQSRSCCS
jgi:hypothetical protein